MCRFYGIVGCKLQSINRIVVSGFLGVISMFFAFSTSGWNGYDESPLVQEIGNITGPTAEAVFAELEVVPFSPDIDARYTPILLARGTAYLQESRRGHSQKKRVRGLSRSEERAIRRAYRAGQTIAILDASTHDVEVLHTLLGVGAAYTSTTDPVLLAYIIRRENGTPASRALLSIRPTPDTAEDPGADERAYARAYDILVGDLLRGPLPRNEPASNLSGDPIALNEHSFQSTKLTSTTGGTYNNLVSIYAGHACDPGSASSPYDFYVVTSGGDWTPTEAKYESASYSANEITLSDDNRDMSIDWQTGKDYCTGGIAVYKGIGGGFDSRICRYVNYPLDYRVELLPPAGPSTTQINAAPSGTQGTATSYSSGFTFGITGDVNISGLSPSAGIGVGAQWSQSVQETVPPLIVKAGNLANEGSFTEYEYCTSGSGSTAESCISTIQTTGQSGTCNDYEIGDPQNGQTPNGRLSNIEQSVYWQVTPDSYGADTSYDITVNFDVNLATSTARLWGGPIEPTGIDSGVGPTGNCNTFGCSCSVGSSTSSAIQTSHTFKVPLPSKDCSSPAPGDECSPTFCAAHPGASCTASPNCAYCDQGACHD